MIMKEKIITSPLGFEDYKRWWQRGRLSDPDGLTYEDGHPVMTHAAEKSDSVIGIMDTRTLRYTYFSPNLYEFTGWDKGRLEQEGVAYTYSTMPPKDIEGAALFSELLTKTFHSIAVHRRPFFKAIFDKRISNTRDGFFRILQICSPIKYDDDGNIDEILFFATKIDNMIGNGTQRLRLTDGDHDVFYHYEHRTSTLCEVEPLTERELQIAKLASRSMTLKEIAADLNISFNTAKAHSGNIIRKLKAKSSIDMVNILRAWQYI